jgi:hypothetical protein
MTPFEIIILVALYLFAFGYMANSYGLSECNTEYNIWKDVFLVVLVAGTIGVIHFPVTFAEDIWNKLNKEEQK